MEWLGWNRWLRAVGRGKQAHEDAELAEALSDALLETLTALVIVVDARGRIVRFNKACEELTGYSFAEVRARPFMDVFLVEEELAQARAVFATLLTGVPAVHENVWRTRNGSLRRIAWRNCVIRDEAGAVAYVVGTGTDLSDRVALTESQAEQQRLLEAARHDVARLTQELEGANHARDELLSVLSHELRNPLAAILAGVEVLRRKVTATSVQAQRPLEIIERNTKLQARLVDDLLDLSRITRGKLHMQRAPVSLAAVVAAAIAEQQAEAERRGLRLECYCAEPLWVLGDFARLQQVIAHLLSNALKFTPSGGLEVRVEERGGRARVIVTDSGIGIEPSMLDRVFDMFGQGAVGGGSRKPGLGIGLSLSRRISEIHGGRVWAESDGPGRGSRFIVELPLIAPPPAVKRDDGVAVATALTVLVVEDNLDTLVLLEESLRSRGYDVVAAATGEEALAKVAQHDIDLILSDIALPGMNGYDLLRAIRRLPTLAEVPAFALTGFGQEEDLRRARDAGYAGHFVKPVDIAVLDERIRDWLAR